MKTKVLVVEDEIIVADSICQFLTETGHTALEPAVSYDEALKSLQENRPDIVLLDIQLRGKKSGIELAKELEVNYKLPFIYLTSNSDEATMNRAIGTSPSAFLVKPLQNEQLLAAIKIAMRLQKLRMETQKERSIFIHNGKEYEKINLDDILYIKSDNVYVEVHLKNQSRIVTRNTLSKFILELNHDFFRVHRSFIVNINNVDKTTKSTITIDSIEIPIGFKYKEQFLKRFLSK